MNDTWSCLNCKEELPYGTTHICPIVYPSGVDRPGPDPVPVQDPSVPNSTSEGRPVKESDPYLPWELEVEDLVVIRASDGTSYQSRVASRSRVRGTIELSTFLAIAPEPLTDEATAWRKKFIKAARDASRAQSQVKDLEIWLRARRALEVAVATFSLTRDPVPLEASVSVERGAYLTALGEMEQEDEDE